MQKIFDEVATLDLRCYKKLFLSEDILMEHAAEGMARFIRERFSKEASIVIVAGSGNNGADGIALARLLHGDFQVSLLHAKEPKSPMALLQKKRADAINVPTVTTIPPCDVLVDAIVGTGFQGEFSSKMSRLIETMSNADAFKIACDMPSFGFIAHATLTMGALKKALYLDSIKDAVGEVEVINLGISRNLYETKTNWHLLEMEDLKLPYRTKNDTHKGSYGHLGVVSGEKLGAAVLASQAALRFGAGLVTLIGFEKEQTLSIPSSIMYAHTLPKTTTALAIGMGLGVEFSQEEIKGFLDNTLALVVDADIFHMDIIHTILQRESSLLTPHPKEFVELLKKTNLADISINQLQKDRFKYVKLFCKAYPHATLLLKGANVIIGEDEEFFINPHGSANLAKGGSGDVLSGLIGALLAQGYKPLDAAINGSLAHTKLSQNYQGADFSLTPDDLIAEIGKL